MSLLPMLCKFSLPRPALANADRLLSSNKSGWKRSTKPCLDCQAYVE
ncbi:hypothetical protein [Azospirillum largimobile]